MKVEIEVSLQVISDTLCSAFEGGSNYWYHIDEFIQPPLLTFLSDRALSNLTGAPARVFRHLDFPLNEGGSLTISDKEDRTAPARTLNLATIATGLKVMAEKYPRHFADMMNEDGDAETGDVLLQCCLFGEVVYG